MAKEERSESGRQTTSGRETSGTQDFQQAARDTKSAARNAQAGIGELFSEAIGPYAELTTDFEAATRQWAQSMRTSVEQTLNLAARFNEIFINDARRASDFYLRLCETNASWQRSMMDEAQTQVQRQSERVRTAAE